ncbi:MAG: cobaltochelatase subunit CobN [Symploca sp. SIO3C6]|nr:cobaltochelatase subunit CobN [Symploca sp. SIO3C6]
MHRLTAAPGGWNPQTEGVIFIEQTPAPIVFISAADTDIQTLAASTTQLPSEFPAIRVVNLLQLQQQLTIDTYAETVLVYAQVIIIRLLGGRSYWSYGLEVVRELVEATGAALVVVPGDDRLDPDLISHSTVELRAVNQIWRYLTEGGVENFFNALKFIADVCLGQNHNPPPPKSVPRVGLYPWEGDNSKRNTGNTEFSNISKEGLRSQESGVRREYSDENLKPCSFSIPFQQRVIEHEQHQVLYPLPQFFRVNASSQKVGILFYRAHYLAGNTAPIDALCQALEARQLEAVPMFVSSLREPDVQAEILSYFQSQDAGGIGLLLNTTSFSLAKLDTQTPRLDLWSRLDVPVLQVILSGGTLEAWNTQLQGLTPRDTAINVALPEVDGRIISRAVSFKSVQTWNRSLETDVVVYEPLSERLEFVADLAYNWIHLRQTPRQERRVALILANYPNRDGRLANGVGLDTPASCVEILKAMQQAGYQIEDLPETGDELIRRLTTGITNDPEGRELRKVEQWLSCQEYQEYFATLPSQVQQGIVNRWGKKGSGEKESNSTAYSIIPIPGIQLGNVFVGIQPSRGYDLDPALNYHAPDLEPTHTYLAFYYWLRQHFGTQAVVHVGKHGNLEWLPGKSLALSNCCYPEVALGAMPHLYPFIVNDPGEGSQAKRRAQAVIIDHLTPPMTRAELYGSLQQLEGLIDEYYQAQSLDPSRLPVINERITKLILQENLHQDLGLNQDEIQNPQSEIPNLVDGYLCQLKEAQIRDGLHIFGKCPQGRQLRDLMIAIARHPSSPRLGLTRALAQDWGVDFDPLTIDLELGNIKITPPLLPLIKENNSKSKIQYVGEAIEQLEQQAAVLVEQIISNSPSPIPNLGDATKQELNWISNHLLPTLKQTKQEISQLLRGLDGCYIPSGPAGAPTRGRPEVLPTGRNFYAVDIRALPTETAWDVGRKAAEAVVELYTQENGEYPQTLGISLWGTATMRTGGDDLAQALALLGVQPIWDGVSRRVVDFEILSLSGLGRPRVDVTLRISGFFRDAFPNLIDLFYNSVAAVASLDESPEQNPLAAQVKQETQLWLEAGLSQKQAQERACHRIFGSKPGAYGAGLQGLIEAQNWTNDEDLARAYINWSSYAYTSTGKGQAAPEAFRKRLQQMQIVLHNQDNREHDLLDSDDYYQFQGGLTVAVRALSDRNPQTYFGDNSIPENPKVRKLREEIARVYRSRVVNPKWIEGVMRHGYKGAFEMAATVDYLFAYDATTNCVEDHMYQGIAQAYIFDQTVQEFVENKNPWALRDMAERLLEANQRGLWSSAREDTLEKLRAIALQAEATIEGINS